MGRFVDEGEAVAVLERVRGAGKRIVFTNGCFDLLHAGHVSYLEQARELGDLLVVGINTDGSVRAIKGPRRPINPLEDRARVLSALACVDLVVLFDEPDPHRLIGVIRPDVLVKGADWPEDRIVGRDTMESRGGRVVRLPLQEGISTSRIIERILELHRPL